MEAMKKLIKKLVKPVHYRFVRPHLPRKIGILNGVPAKQPRLTDTKVIRPEYEAELIDAMEREIEPNDDVTIVGAGFGVSLVYAANLSTEGTVRGYEGGAERLSYATETLRYNDVNDRVELKHAIVGRPVAVKGDGTDAPVVRPESLPKSDVLVMDCEGSEVDIIERMDIRPRVVIVETHGCFDVPTEDSKQVLRDAGYEIVSCVEDDAELGIDIMTAYLENWTHD